MPLTVSFFRRPSSSELNIRMISARAALREGIVMPFVAAAATWIISLNLGCSTADMGYMNHEKIQNIGTLRLRNLVCTNQPLNDGTPEHILRVLDVPLLG